MKWPSASNEYSAAALHTTISKSMAEGPADAMRPDRNGGAVAFTKLIGKVITDIAAA